MNINNGKDILNRVIDMSRFLKLTNFIINTNDIHKIVIYPNKYHIHIVGKKLDGFHWGIGAFGLGSIYSYTSEIEVCETAHSTDYKIVSAWIHRLDS
jgi:hypothetical protein